MGFGNLVDALARGNVAHFDGWCAVAQPKARTVFGVTLGDVRACGPGVSDRMNLLAEHGLVLLVQQRDPDSRALHHLAVRSSRALPAGFPQLAALAPPPKRVLTTAVRKRAD